MMSQTNDGSYGYNWSVVFIISIQFGILWVFAQFLLRKLTEQAWQMNLKLFIVGVLAIVLLNNCLYFAVKSILISIYRPELPLYSHFILGLNTVEGFLKGTLVMSMLFSLNFFKRWKVEFKENETLKSKELELQNRALKSQLNPHFLFNNLNTLSGLIKQDPIIANEFLTEMSDMYRYILKSTDEEVVPLEKEIQFAENYSRLLKNRFGKNFNYSIDVQDLSYLLPPISLHLLLENIVKHNRIDDQYPMTFTIVQNADYLCVENKINLKSQLESTKKGLHILTEQYKFLTDKPISIIEEKGLFLVKLPLLKLN